MTLCLQATSGLDSTIAHKVVVNLKDLAKAHNMAVVMSIHQPSSQIFQQFDDLLFLADGWTVYNGSAV